MFYFKPGLSYTVLRRAAWVGTSGLVPVAYPFSLVSGSRQGGIYVALCERPYAHACDHMLMIHEEDILQDLCSPSACAAPLPCAARAAALYRLSRRWLVEKQGFALFLNGYKEGEDFAPWCLKRDLKQQTVLGLSVKNICVLPRILKAKVAGFVLWYVERCRNRFVLEVIK